MAILKRDMEAKDLAEFMLDTFDLVTMKWKTDRKKKNKKLEKIGKEELLFFMSGIGIVLTDFNFDQKLIADAGILMIEKWKYINNITDKKNE